MLDPSPLLYSNVSVQPIVCLLPETYQPMAIISLSHLQGRFSPTSIAAETASGTTPPLHILPTNQETLFHQGPCISGHIVRSRYGMEERFAFRFPVMSTVLYRRREVGAPVHLQDLLPRNSGGMEQTRTVTCKMLITMGNDRHTHIVLCVGENRWPRSDTIRQAALDTKTTISQEK
ncbi:hypothetical protein TNCV_354561 [Trichonephila clavipes]|uniref:Uncharacterized protein n=1 Tax=Trichonephila clavipes TaxID=2585209 RepID=A0A8X6W158_TRICX|nr:hypothetical protein TNCV_354561 [Trichonephila clavipes]